MCGALEEVGAGAAAQLLVLLNVDVDSEDAHHLSQDEGQAAKVEGPAVRVMPLLILILLGGDVTERCRDVHDHSDDVAKP